MHFIEDRGETIMDVPCCQNISILERMRYRHMDFSRSNEMSEEGDIFVSEMLTTKKSIIGRMIKE